MKSSMCTKIGRLNVPENCITDELLPLNYYQLTMKQKDRANDKFLDNSE